MHWGQSRPITTSLGGELGSGVGVGGNPKACLNDVPASAADGPHNLLSFCRRLHVPCQRVLQDVLAPAVAHAPLLRHFSAIVSLTNYA